MECIKNITEKNCCGCGACQQICPQKAIQLVENERGFIVPEVDTKKCILCGLCNKVCPEKNLSTFNENLAAYAAVTKEKEKQMKSTSGGVFRILAEKVLNQKGIVVGVSWNTPSKVSHEVITSIDMLDRILQSKYIQSDTTINRTFEKTKEYLKKDKVVLYSGTACQIAGLKKYLQKEYDNLITLEVACHGVPSPGLFRKYLEWIEKNEKSKVKEYRFRNRDKHPGGEHYKSSALFENGQKKYYYYKDDPYYNSFMIGTTIRKTCYNCKYKQKKRIADITLADFWGIEKEYPDFPAYYGCSGVLINTLKAEKLFNSIKHELVIKKCSANDVYKHNVSMLKSTEPNNDILKSINVEQEELIKKLKVKPKSTSLIKDFFKKIIPYSIKYRIKRIKKGS